jgi:hypothetical protein
MYIGAMETPPGGLCDHCQNCKRIESPRGSVFRLCLLHDRDPRYAKYPRVPVLSCAGYRPAMDTA